MCFHWKSLRRQVRILGSVEEVSASEADEYYNSRPYKNRMVHGLHLNLKIR